MGSFKLKLAEFISANRIALIDRNVLEVSLKWMKGAWYHDLADISGLEF